MRITIVGGGNMGTLMAAEFASRSHDVTVYTSAPERWQKRLVAFDVDGAVVYEGEVSKITSDVRCAADAEYIFVTLPSIAQADFVKKLLPYVKADTKIGVVPGYGGAEFIFKPLVDAGAHLFGFQRVHAITRIFEYGKTVCMKGRKDSVFLGALDRSDIPALCEDMESLFDMPCVALPNYLCVTLTPSNPILHTSRLYGMLGENNIDHVYDRNILFYEEWTDRDSELLFSADEELQRICKKIVRADLSSVRSLKDHYESHSIGAMTNKIRSISAFRGIGSPMKAVDGGWIADLDSRYFSCDFAYGLDLLCQLGKVLSVATPTMDEMMGWYRDISGMEKRVLDLESCGIDSLDSIYKFYNII